MKAEKRSSVKSSQIEVFLLQVKLVTFKGQKFEDHFKEIQEKFGSIESEANKIEEYTAELEKVKGDTQGVTDKLKTLTEKSDIFQTLMTETNTFFGKTKSDMEKVRRKVSI